MTKREANQLVAGAKGESAGLPTLLERLDQMDRTLQISLGKPGLSLYGQAATEIRRLMELLNK
jgi:hypothetical protein